MNGRKNQVYRLVRDYYTAEIDMSGERVEVLVWMHRTCALEWNAWDEERGECRQRFERDLNRELTHLREDVQELISDVGHGRAKRWEGRLLRR